MCDCLVKHEPLKILLKETSNNHNYFSYPTYVLSEKEFLILKNDEHQ